MVCWGNSQFPNVSSLIFKIFIDKFWLISSKFLCLSRNYLLIVYAIGLCTFALEIKLRCYSTIYIDGSLNLNFLFRNIAVSKLSKSSIKHLLIVIKIIHLIGVNNLHKSTFSTNSLLYCIHTKAFGPVILLAESESSYSY